MSRILVIGGYGGFGARLSRRLVAAGHPIIVGGRSFEKAKRFCEALPGAEPAMIDRSGNIGSALMKLKPALVIDAAGPFQQSGYGVPEACIDHGCSYLDLADATQFVTGIGELDGAARKAGVSVVSGASSVPALSGAVVRRLAHGLDRVTQVDIALSATTRSTATKSVTGAILSYAGKAVRLSRGGRWTHAFGGSDLRRIRFETDGVKPLQRRWVALCDVPDLGILPDMLPGCPAVTFRAGSDRAPQILGLWMASWLVKLGILRSLSRFRGLFLALQKATMWSNSRRSAMQVAVLGWRRGERIERRWTLIAEDESGPEIPTLAAALVAGRFVTGELAPGARDASLELRLEDFDDMLNELPLRHRITERVLGPTLYRRVMGADFDRLPRAVREMHEVNGDAGAFGQGVVLAGDGMLPRVLRRLMGFPPAGTYPLHVAFSERRRAETWERAFGPYKFRSLLGQDRQGLVERFGPIGFGFDLLSDDGGLRMVMRRWSFLGLPMPLFLAPKIMAREWEENGRFQFEVEAAMPLIGHVIAYRGWLKPSASNEMSSGPRLAAA